jgi:hypothetical protein
MAMCSRIFDVERLSPLMEGTEVQGGTVTTGLGGGQPRGCRATDFLDATVGCNLSKPPVDSREGGTTKTMLTTTDGAAATFAGGDQGRMKQ